MIHKSATASLFTTACFASLFLFSPNQTLADYHDHDHGHDHGPFGISIEINGPPPARPHYIEKRWAPPSPEAVWVDAHYEWSNGTWVWVGGYYMYPPHPGYIWVPGHYLYDHHVHTWVAGYWQAPTPPAPVVVVQQPAPPPPSVQTSSAPYGNRIGTTSQIQSPYSANIITSTAPRDTIVYDPSTGQPFRVP